MINNDLPSINHHLLRRATQEYNNQIWLKTMKVIFCK